MMIIVRLFDDIIDTREAIADGGCALLHTLLVPGLECSSDNARCDEMAIAHVGFADAVAVHMRLKELSHMAVERAVGNIQTLGPISQYHCVGMLEDMADIEAEKAPRITSLLLIFSHKALHRHFAIPTDDVAGRVEKAVESSTAHTGFAAEIGYADMLKRFFVELANKRFAEQLCRLKGTFVVGEVKHIESACNVLYYNAFHYYNNCATSVPIKD